MFLYKLQQLHSMFWPWILALACHMLHWCNHARTHHGLCRSSLVGILDFGSNRWAVHILYMLIVTLLCDWKSHMRYSSWFVLKHEEQVSIRSRWETILREDGHTLLPQERIDWCTSITVLIGPYILKMCVKIWLYLYSKK